MLIKRVLTGIVLVFLALFCVLGITAKSFFFVLILLYVLASWEWSQFINFDKKSWRFLFVLFMLVGLIQFIYVPKVSYDLWLMMGVFWWMTATYLVFLYPRLRTLWQSKAARVLIALFALVPFVITANVLRAQVHGPDYILFVLLLVWSVDTGAYAWGRLCGKTLLIPRVSPKKTWAGLIGGLLTALVVCMAMALWVMPHVIDTAHGWRPLLLVILVTSFAAVLGDLTQSMFKREVGLKDSGKLLPGHGGVLDRIDSLIAAMPIFVYSLYFIGSKFSS